uniref:PLA2-6 n=1 Tax=Demansia vestigiata TaxID=412038 RepID=A6MFM5_DEMVE|nr:PLA2-6 precursor [Demansia vestigiata]
MFPARLLVLLGVCVSLLGATRIPTQPLHLMQFADMITCANRNTRSWISYTNYGCYCGSGGSGTPVDDLDRCCQVHDDCYGEAQKLPECNPYKNFYSYECAEGQLTCKDDNDECKALICKCDRLAAICFAKAPYNTKNFMMNDKTPCQVI